MHAVGDIAPTPRRKRAASDSVPRLNDVAITAGSIFGSPSTPGIESVPELDCGDTPQSTADSPRTPSSTVVPLNVPPIYEEAPDTPKRLVNGPRRSARLMARASPQSMPPDLSKDSLSKLGCSDLKPAPLFPLYLYPFLPAIKLDYTAVPHFVKGDISQGNFKFHEWSKASRVSKSEHEEADIPLPRYELRKLRETERKRFKEAASKIEKAVRYMTTTAASSQLLLDKSKAISHGEPVRDNQSRLALGGVTNKRFSRILPIDALHRFTEDPERCVASLISRPRERCSRLMKSPGDVEGWLATKISELEDPSNLITSESYIRELINTMTCSTHHLKIATAQLERLLDRCHNRRDRQLGNQHDFTQIDIEAVECWLEALTKPLGEFNDQSIQTLPPTCTPINTFEQSTDCGPELGLKIVGDVVLQNVDPSHSCREGVEARHISTKVVSLQTTESRGALQAGHTSVKCSQTGQIFRTSSTVEVTQTVTDAKPIKTDPDIGAIRSTTTFQTMEIVQQAGPARHIGSDHQVVPTDETGVLVKTIDATSIVDIKTEPSEGTHGVEATSFASTQLVETFQRFDASLIGESISTVLLSTTAAAKRKLRADPWGTRLNEEGLQTLHQRFGWYKKGVNIPVKEWIHERLVNPLTWREWAPPEKGTNGSLRYPSQRLNYPGQGLIYMYWVPGNFGFVKIGKTSGESTDTRLKSWVRQCGHRIEEHTRDEEAEAVQLPHVYRVEALVHAELKNFRLKEKSCRKCTREHQEWFAVSPSHAQKVISKWSNWMLGQPYVPTRGKWRLKETVSAQEIDDLCTPIEMSAQEMAALPILLQNSKPTKPASKGKTNKKSKKQSK